MFYAKNLSKLMLSLIRRNKNYEMDYKKKKLEKISCNNSYEEIDTRLATGWYVDAVGKNKTKKYKTKEVSFKISKKQIK